MQYLIVAYTLLTVGGTVVRAVLWLSVVVPIEQKPGVVVLKTFVHIYLYSFKERTNCIYLRIPLITFKWQCKSECFGKSLGLVLRSRTRGFI